LGHEVQQGTLADIGSADDGDAGDGHGAMVDRPRTPTRADRLRTTGAPIPQECQKVQGADPAVLVPVGEGIARRPRTEERQKVQRVNDAVTIEINGAVLAVEIE